MQYHELRILVPAEASSNGGVHVMGGLEVAHLVHDAVTPAIGEALGDDTAPVIVLWEACRSAAASGAL